MINNQNSKLNHIQHSTITGSTYRFSCQACNRSYTKRTPKDDYLMSSNDAPIVTGPKYCYEGHHTTKPIPVNDLRRVSNDVVVITGDDMQSQIDALDDKVRILKFHGGGLCNDEAQPKLTRSLPNLEELQVHSVAMNELKLTKENCPKLHTVYFENVTQEEEPNFTLLLPELRHFTIYYYGPADFMWLYHMSCAARKLESFDSYKLRVDALYFASNDLKSIRLNRAELLTELKLFTPNLVSLDITSCHDLEYIDFVKENKDLGKDENINGEELVVINNFALLGEPAVKALNEHPRVHREITSGDMDDDMW